MINHNHMLRWFSGSMLAWSVQVPWLNPDYGQVSVSFTKLLRYMQLWAWLHIYCNAYGRPSLPFSKGWWTSINLMVE